jgi:putative nucleotidyltransferase with HDIG domain
MEQQLSDLIILLANGISQRRMYFDDHPRVVATAGEVAAGLNAVMAKSDGGAFSFGVFNGKFVRNGHYLVGPSIAGRALIDFAEQLGCGGFSFRPPLDPDHVTTFFRLGAARLEKPANLAQAQALLAANGIGHILLAALLQEDAGHADGGAGADALDLAVEFAPLLQVYQSMYETVSANALAVHRGGAVDLVHARDTGLQLIGLADQGTLDVMQFMRYPDYDSFTIGHSVRVAALSTMVGRKLGWPTEVLAELTTAGLLHDVGKSRVPEEILFKPGKLDPDERRVMESHPTAGAQILLESGEKNPLVVSAAWGHHLRHDGGGYPSMPDSYRPGAVAELVHVCDVFEALTACRPYKSSLTPRKAYEIMLQDAAAFHPRLLAELVTTMGLYPPGSVVHLSDRSTAVVVSRGPTLDHPCVRVTCDADGQPIPRDLQPAIDLHRQPELAILDIVVAGAGGK